MNRSIKLGALAALMLLAAPAGLQAENPKPFTVPEVRGWKGLDGSFSITPGATRVTYTNPYLSEVARQFASDYLALTGNALEVVKGKGGKNDISIGLKKEKTLGKEGYSVDITDRIVISAQTVEGARWGATTLLQLCEAGPEIPQGKITDFPEYGWRGFMIDVGRKFIPLEYLYKLVDIMAYHKMNELHIHLNDNGFKYYYDEDWDKTQAAFRLESETFPGLTARDGAYTKAEFRDFQKYAATRGVDIVPEIDFPAHTLAFTRFMPEIASTDGVNGVDHLNLDSPKTYEFLDALLAEYLKGPDPVFVGPTFHIGTDEYKGDSIVMEKFRALTDRYLRYTEELGKKPAMWGSLTHAKGKTPVKSDGVTMYMWYNGYADPKEMMEQGYDMVSIPDGYVYIVPGAGYYYDYLNTKMLYDQWTPAQIGDQKIEERHPQLKGGMFAVWNDHPNNGITVKDIHHRVMHALPTMAAKTWSGENVTVPFEEFEAKSSVMSEAPGVNYLGRVVAEPSLAFEAETVEPGSILPLQEIGYNYTVEFDLEGADEAKGTPLFTSPYATVWLSDPISGKMGYSREDDLMKFRHNVRPGEKNHYRITGDNKGTKLYIDGKLVDDMNIRWLSYNGKNKMAQVRTLVFPLHKAGPFRSKLKNLKVYNYIKE